MSNYFTYAFLQKKADHQLIELSASTHDSTADAGSDSKTTVTPKNLKKEMEFYPWGKDNDMPDKLIRNSAKNIIVASNLDFNAKMIYGDTITPVIKEVSESGEMKYRQLVHKDAPEIFEWIENNNYQYTQSELSHDFALLNNGYVELVFNKERTKIVRMKHLEAAHSRLQVMNDKGVIEFHGYCSDWAKTDDNPPVVTRLLDFGNPLHDLNVKLGKIRDDNGKNGEVKDVRFVMHLAPPSPGKFYYQKAYWWSIFESYWFDFSCAIPEFKMNLMKNQMVLKYKISIRRTFFDDLYKAEGITEDKKKTERKKEFLTQLENFLAGKENAGKNIVSHHDYDAIKGGELREDIIIKPIESFIKGGEYIEDSEEASNAICYAMGVHPSLQGASPGKGKTINGTEARELFIINQSMKKSFRELLVRPLNVVKAINGWDKDVDFIIPNIMLTTLDKNTGAQKQIGNQIQ